MTMENREISPREITRAKEEVQISAEILLADNRSDKAREGINRWHENANTRNLIQSDTCADSRQEIPNLERSVTLQTISTGGKKEEYRGLLNNNAISAVANVAHHAGNTVRPKEVPRGCGGEDARLELENNGPRGAEEGIGHYVENEIYHSDVIVQSCFSAIEITRMTEKPVLAATQDHLTGEIHPLLAFWTKGNTSYDIHHKSINLDDILNPNSYSPAKIYAEGLPCIEIDDLPEVFQEYLMANRSEMEKLHVDYPDFYERQKNQNPATIVVSTDIRPIRLRYPQSFDAPGSVFRLSLPRRKYINGTDLTVEIPIEQLQSVINQTQYPIEHFSNVKNVLIETRSYEKSLELADALLSKRWMKEWQQKEGAQVIIAETQGGRLNRIADLKP